MVQDPSLAAVRLGLICLLVSIGPAIAGDKLQEGVSAPTNDTGTSQTAFGDQAARSASEKVTPERLDQWTKDLIHSKFAIRQLASQKLQQAGHAGMVAVAKSADSPDLELATRCLAILGEGLISPDDATMNAARDALHHLTKSQHKSVAQRAQRALETPANPPPGLVPLGFRNGRPLPMAANNVAIQVTINNGRRETKITENGKEVVIKDNNRQDIQVSITETVDGMKKTSVAEGKDADDLKQNHPEAHVYYEKYGQGNGELFRVQIGANPPAGKIPGGDPKRAAGAVVRRLPRLISPVKASGLFEEVEQLRLNIDAANERLAKSAEAEQPNVVELKAISQEIRAATKRLAEIKNESTIP